MEEVSGWCIVSPEVDRKDLRVLGNLRDHRDRVVQRSLEMEIPIAMTVSNTNFASDPTDYQPIN